MTRVEAFDDDVVPPPACLAAPLAIALALALALRMPADAGRRTLPLAALHASPPITAPIARIPVDAATRHRPDGARPARSRMTPKETAR